MTLSWDVSSWQGVTLSWDNDTVSWDVSSCFEKCYHDKGWHIVFGCVITTVSDTVWCKPSYECQVWRKELCLLWNWQLILNPAAGSWILTSVLLFICSSPWYKGVILHVVWVMMPRCLVEGNWQFWGTWSQQVALKCQCTSARLHGTES